LPKKHNNTKKVRDHADALKRAKDDIARGIAVTVMNFFVDSFQRQGWLDQSLQPWPQKNPFDPKRQGGATLIERGHLRDSIQIKSQHWKDIQVVSSGVAYAQAHNEGMTLNVPVTDRMRNYFWAKYMETNLPEYKWMAMTKKTSFEINLEQRKFFGHSKAMFREIDKIVRDIINRKLRRT